MKFIVAVDVEGVACAVAPYGGSCEDSSNIVSVKKQATLEANAAAEALFDCGAKEVIVWDNHSSGCNLIYDELDERCKIAIGATVFTRFPLEGDLPDGAVFIGYHARAAAQSAVLAHTYSSTTYQEIKINGKEYGEIGIDAAIAGQYGFPVIFLSSDDKGVSEGKEILPWIETVETKKSFSYTRILSKHPKTVIKEIYDGVYRACKRINEMKCFTIKTPFELEVRYRRPDTAQHAKIIDLNGIPFGLKDVYTRVGKLNNVEDIIFRI